jgi:hypothetical protein
VEQNDPVFTVSHVRTRSTGIQLSQPQLVEILALNGIDARSHSIEKNTIDMAVFVYPLPLIRCSSVSLIVLSAL